MDLKCRIVSWLWGGVTRDLQGRLEVHVSDKALKDDDVSAPPEVEGPHCSQTADANLG